MSKRMKLIGAGVICLACVVFLVYMSKNVKEEHGDKVAIYELAKVQPIDPGDLRVDDKIAVLVIHCPQSVADAFTPRMIEPFGIMTVKEVYADHLEVEYRSLHQEPLQFSILKDDFVRLNRDSHYRSQNYGDYWEFNRSVNSFYSSWKNGSK